MGRLEVELSVVTQNFYLLKKIFFELNPFLLFIEADFLFMYLLLAHNVEY